MADLLGEGDLRSMRACLAVALALSLTACAAVKGMLEPAGRSWPSPADERVQRHHDVLNATGSSVRDPIEAEDQARKVLRRYLERLEVRGEPGEKETRIRAALRRAGVATGRGDGGTYTSTLEIPLADLQQLLGTEYD